MLNLIMADCYKLRKSAALKTGVAITMISAAAMVYIAYLLSEGQVGADVSGSASLLLDIVILSITGSIVAGVYICGDFENKTIHGAVSCGNSRSAVILSKTIVYILAVAVMVLPYPVITAVALGTGYEFGEAFGPSVFLHILAEHSGSALTAGELMKLLPVTLAMIAVHAARLGACVLFAFILKKPAFVVGLGIAVTILGDFTVTLADKVPFIGKVFLYTPFAMNAEVVSLNAGAGDLMKAIAVSIAFILIILAVTAGIFRRTEIK
jgi:ABC-2 type transport system permease protein